MKPFLKFIVKFYFKLGKVTHQCACIGMAQSSSWLSMELCGILNQSSVNKVCSAWDSTIHLQLSPWPKSGALCGASSLVKRARQNEAWLCRNVTYSVQQGPWPSATFYTGIKETKEAANVYCPENRYNKATHQIDFPHLTRNGKYWSFCKLFQEAV